MSAEHFGGVVLALMGATGDSLGCILQKLSHDRAAAAAAESGEPEPFYLSRLSWWRGFGVFVAGILFSFAALAFIGQAVAILLGAWGLCVNLYMAPIVLNESRSWRDVVAVGVMVVGIGLSVGAARPDNAKWSEQRILLRFRHPDVVVFLIVLFGLIAITFISTRVNTPVFRRKWVGAPKDNGVAITTPSTTTHTNNHHPHQCPSSDDNCNDDEGVKEKDDDADADERALSLTLRLQHVLLAALVATVTVTFAKATSELLKDRADGHHSFEGVGALILVPQP
jgi:Protein of unknown function (DUF803).